MKPVEGNDDFCETPSGSGLKNPATSIVWTGPDIPCIELCSGDTIDKVIYDIAMILCDITDNVLDVTKLDFKCLVADGACPPDTLLETLQLMITKSCIETTTTTGGGSSALPMVSLPRCLWYSNAEGDTINSLKLDEYASYLAVSICKIITDVTSIKSQIVSLNNQITTLTATVSGGGSTGGGSSSSATIISKCLSAPTPGQTLNLTTAFQNLEEKMCSYIQLIGQTTQWNALLGDECIDLNTDLPDDSGKYGDIVGWFDDPQSVYESMSNLWKVVCKLNAVQAAGGGGGTTGGCTILQVPTVFYNATNTTISWSAPSSVVGLNAYKVTVRNQTTGAVIFSTTVAYPVTSYQLPTLSPYTANQSYNVEVISQFECGDSPATIAPVILKTLTIDYKAVYQLNPNNMTPFVGCINCVPQPGENCLPVDSMEECEDTQFGGWTTFFNNLGQDYTQKSDTITITLNDPVTGAQKLNSTGADIILKFCYEKEFAKVKNQYSCTSQYTNNNLITQVTYNVIIPNGQSSSTLTVVTEGRDNQRSCRRFRQAQKGFKGFYNAANVALTNISQDASTLGLVPAC
jgi:hypothetical protein